MTASDPDRFEVTVYYPPGVDPLAVRAYMEEKLTPLGNGPVAGLIFHGASVALPEPDDDEVTP